MNGHELDRKIIELHATGIAFADIARVLGNTYATIYRRVRKLKLLANHKKYPVATNLKSQIGDKAFEYLSNKQWLFDKYIIQYRSTRQIAAELGCGKKAVLSALRRHNIEVGRQGVPKDIEAHSRKSFLQQASTPAIGRVDNYDWLYNQYIKLNRCMADIAKECNTSKRAIVLWLRKHNIRKPKHLWQESVNAGYKRANGFAVGSEEACRKRMRGRRGIIITTTKSGQIHCHSSWEIKVAEFLNEHPAVQYFSKDTLKIPYILNKPRFYFPDFIVKTKLSTIIIEVKPTKLLDNTNVIAKIAALKEFSEQYEFKYLVVGGKHKVDLIGLQELLDKQLDK